MTAVLGLSGRAGDQRLRGVQVGAGFARPSSMRLEAVAAGQLIFVLAAADGDATVLLPRESRVLRNARPDEILAALTGVNLAPADLRAILTGCVVPDGRPTGGRIHANGWASIDLEGDATMYLQRGGAGWQVRAARRSGWRIDYPMWEGNFPATVRLLSDEPARVDLTASISDPEINVDLEPAAFMVNVPPDAVSLSLDELRNRGPLQGP